MHEKKHHDHKNGGGSHPIPSSFPAGLLIIAIVTACCLLGIPVFAADIVFTGNVTESVTDTLSVPVGGMGIGLYTGSAYAQGSQGIKQVDYTFTDSQGGYSLKLTPVTDPQVSSAFIVLNGGPGLSLKSIQSPGGKEANSAEVFGTPQNGILVIKYSAPLSGKDYSHNDFVLQSVNEQPPAGMLLLRPSISTMLDGMFNQNFDISGDVVITNLDMTIDYSQCPGFALHNVNGTPDAEVYDPYVKGMLSATDTGSSVKVAKIFPQGVNGGKLRGWIVFTTPQVVKPCIIRFTGVQGNRLDGSPIQFLTKDAQVGSVVSRGDCNKDGGISSIDALMALQMSTGEIPADLNCDINSDGKVTSYDAVQILNQAGKAITWENPIGTAKFPTLSASAAPSASTSVAPGPGTYPTVSATLTTLQPVPLETVMQQQVVIPPSPTQTVVPATTTVAQVTPTTTLTPVPLLTAVPGTTEQIVGVRYARR